MLPKTQRRGEVIGQQGASWSGQILVDLETSKGCLMYIPYELDIVKLFSTRALNLRLLDIDPDLSLYDICY